MTRIKTDLSDPIVAQLDEARGHVSRSRWIKEAVELRLQGWTTPESPTTADLIETLPVRAPAPVESALPPPRLTPQIAKPAPRGVTHEFKPRPSMPFICFTCGKNRSEH